MALDSALIVITILERLIKLSEHIEARVRQSKKATPAEERAAWQALQRLKERLTQDKGEQ